MPTFFVYHKKDPDFRAAEKVFIRNDYDLVAEVDCESISDVFFLTNHIEHSWFENEEITWHATIARSTSVGDVILDKYPSEDKRWIPMMVDSIGFKKLDWPE